MSQCFWGKPIDIQGELSVLKNFFWLGCKPLSALPMICKMQVNKRDSETRVDSHTAITKASIDNFLF